MKIKIKINRENYKPISHQIKEQIKKMIDEGIFKKGEILPPVRYFEELLGVSFQPVRKALLELKEEGLVYSKQGSGWYVTKERHHSFKEIEKQALSESLKNMPISFIIHKKQIEIGLLDIHTSQIRMWNEVFENFKKIDRYVDIKLTLADAEKPKDLLQVMFSQFKKNRENYEELSKFKTIQDIKFSDIFDVYLKPVRDRKNLWGLPSTLCFPLIYLNKKFAAHFSKMEKKENFGWKDYLNTCIDFALSHPDFQKGFVLSFISPLYYFLINGIEPYKVINGKIKLNLNEKVIEIFKDIQTMGEKKIYVEREIEKTGIDSKKIFFEGKSALMESYNFYKFMLIDRNMDYQIFPLPCNHNGKIPVNCSYWMLAKSSNEKRVCCEILKYLLSPDAQKIIAKHRIFPSLKSIANSSYFSPPKNENKKAQLISVEKGINLDTKEEIFHRFLEGFFNYHLDRFINRINNLEETITNLKEAVKNFQTV